MAVQNQEIYQLKSKLRCLKQIILETDENQIEFFKHYILRDRIIRDFHFGKKKRFLIKSSVSYTNLSHLLRFF